eukprot:scaffold28406_cov112-Isochrysis_galbana.AAC.3
MGAFMRALAHPSSCTHLPSCRRKHPVWLSHVAHAHRWMAQRRPSAVVHKMRAGPRPSRLRRCGIKRMLPTRPSAIARWRAWWPSRKRVPARGWRLRPMALTAPGLTQMIF